MITIAAAGAITPVGLNLTDTVAGIYTHVQLVEDLGVLDDEGEALSGMKVPLGDGLSSAERITTMAHALVEECTASVEEQARPIPLVLCCAEPADEEDFATPLLAEVIAKAPVAIDAHRSRVIARGRAGVLQGIGVALAALKEGSVERCLVGGVDSLVGDARVEKLASEERLLTQKNKDGFIAGEGGGMLLLRNGVGETRLASWLGAASANEEATRDSNRPVTGTGIQEAIGKALALAQVSFDTLGCVAHDFSGEQRYFEELLLACSRLAKGKSTATVEIPALSVGETGPAGSFLAIAMLAFLHSRGVNQRPSLAVVSCDGPERGAVVLGPVAGDKR